MKDFKLISFFLFDPTLRATKHKPSEEEMQEAKIIFYYPPTDSMYIQRSNTGIVEGTIEFAKLFNGSLNSENFLVVELSSSVILTLECEKNKYIGLISEYDNSKNSISSDYESRRNCFRHLIKNLYQTLILFQGPISSIMNPNTYRVEVSHNEVRNENQAFHSSVSFKENNKSKGINDHDQRISSSIYIKDKPMALTQQKSFYIKPSSKLIDKQASDEKEIENEATLDWKTRRSLILSDFIHNYFVSINYKSRIPFLDKLNYFPLSDTGYSQILLATRRLKEKFPYITYTMILFKGYLIHNELSLDTATIIYNHFFSNLDSSPKYKDFKQPPFQVTQTVYGGYNPNCKDANHCTSNLRKGYDGQDSYFLIGINSMNINNYQYFIPEIYISSTGETLKLMVFQKENLLFFFLLNKTFELKNSITKLLYFEKWIKKYFETEYNNLVEIYKIRSTSLDISNFVYFNNTNSSIKLSSHFFDKNKLTLIDTFDRIIPFILKGYFAESDIIDRITKSKNFYVVSSITLNRKVYFIAPSSSELKEVMQKYSEFKKQMFDHFAIL